MIPRFGEPLRRGQHYRRRPGAYALLLRGDQVLLTHQEKPVPEFQLPGGGIDPGEGALAALHREVREETGWGISGIRRIGAYRRFVYMPDYNMWAEKICLIHVARPTVCYGAPTEKGHRAVWQDIDKAIETLSSKSDRQFISQVFGLRMPRK
ncbi:NUDIX hydrolase [Thioclava litoralis]|uniref:NUDIX hydrolase n=1 Tax=Thioclava litoralis TaxID=3076557 RepID=A0ABZ1E2H0_9RHOB|nr:NUDIX hydrolase [Thioclava sp. FTW29]